MKPRKVGMIPAKADVEAQQAFKKKVSAATFRKPKQASAPFFSWMQPISCLRPFWAWFGVSKAVCQKRPQAASG